MRRSEKIISDYLTLSSKEQIVYLRSFHQNLDAELWDFFLCIALDKTQETSLREAMNVISLDGKFVEVTERDIEGKWSVFFFYPADFTFVCPTELGDLADHYAKFKKRGVEIYSVSTDTHFTHKAWHSSSDTIAKIQYTMIGDPTGQLTRNFENMREDQGLADRSTFIVDPQGILHAVEITAEGIGRDASDLLAK